MAVAVVNGLIWVNELRNNCHISQGKNMNNSWSLWTKSNNPLGNVPGLSNIFITATSVLVDNDAADTNTVNVVPIENSGGAIAEVV